MGSSGSPFGMLRVVLSSLHQVSAWLFWDGAGNFVEHMATAMVVEVVEVTVRKESFGLNRRTIIDGCTISKLIAGTEYCGCIKTRVVQNSGSASSLSRWQL